MFRKTPTVTPHRRTFRPEFDRCEDRVVMTLPALGKVASTLVGSLGSTVLDQGTGMVLGAALGAIGFDDGSHAAEFAKLDEKLKGLQDDVKTLLNDVSVLTHYAEHTQLTTIVQALNISAIDTLWDKFRLLEQLSASNPKRPPGAPVATAKDADLLAHSIVKDLEYSVARFSAAFLARHQGSVSPPTSLPLMKVYSDILKKSVPSVAGGTTASTPFLTSNYSTQMAEIYNYYADEEAKAVFLLVNAYRYLHAPGQAYSVEVSFPTDHPKYGTAAQKQAAKDHFLAQANTAPHYAIPNFMVVDYVNHKGWSQFDGLGTGAHSTKTQLLYYLRGQESSFQYIAAAARPAALAAHNAEKASGLPWRVLDWRVPSLHETSTLGRASYLTPRGFHNQIYLYQVWTSDIVRRPAVWTDRWGQHGDMFSTEVANVPGTNDVWYVYPDNAPSGYAKDTGTGRMSIYVTPTFNGEFYV